jgi:hypothetical protein
MLANLSKMSNPMGAVSQILLGRFVAGPCYSHITRTTNIKETVPHQSQIAVDEVLTISNDRTHLEGKWKAKKANIQTKKFTTSAPKHTMSQTVETSGYTIALSPAALAGACFSMGTATAIGCLPSVSVIDGDMSADGTENVPMTLDAEEVFIRSGDVVFSGSTIRAKMVDMIVAGDMTVETLLNTFRSEGNSTQLGTSIAAIFGAVRGGDSARAFVDPKLGAIPTVRFAEEEEIKGKIDTVAGIVGIDTFYLKVGGLLLSKGAEVGPLKPDGVVTQTPQQRLEAKKILTEKVNEVNKHKRSAINPCLGEAVAMLGQVEEFSAVRNQIEADMRLRSKDSAQIKKVMDNVKQSDIDKVANIKQKIVNSQKKVALKVQEVAQKTLQVTVSKETTQRQLQAQLIQCCYVQELDDTIKTSVIEQQAAMKEYETYSKKLDPEVKSYFDRIMNAVGDFCHQFNDFMQRSSEVTDMYLHLDDNLTDEFQRHEIKEAIINREVREKRNNWLELAETGLRTLEFTAVAGTAKVMTSAAREVRLARLLAESLAIARNKMPYDPRAVEQLLKLNKQGVVSHTIPEFTAKNAKLAGQRHPDTGIVFDQKGFPIFDDVAKVETRITGDLSKMTPDAHMRAATRKLREDVLAGKVDRKMFTDAEWTQIKGGHEKIGEYTWHHHQDSGRMQLVPSKIHKDTGHLGGDDLWGIK